MSTARKGAGGDARQTALQTLLRLGEQGTVQAVLDATLRAARLERRDSALATELVYGYLRTELRIDCVLSALLARPRKLPPEMYTALGMAAYALLFLQRIPHHATVDWTVRHVRARFGMRLAGVANGALRSLIRLGEAPLRPEFYHAPASTPEERLAAYYAMPLWIVRLWRTAYGEETAERLLARAFTPPWPSIRCNARHPEYAALLTAAVEAGGVRVGEHGVAFAPGAVPEMLLRQDIAVWHGAGALSWQAAGSQEALAHAGEWGRVVWDACAGQGGKSLALLEDGVPVGLCSDMHSGRLRLLQRTAERLGMACPPCARASALRPPLRRWEGDMLLDVPCSGLGTLARRPEIRRRRDMTDVHDLVALQRQMLASAWHCLSPGGGLIYMTCTLNPAENGEQIAAFLREHPAARCESQWQTPHEHPWMEGMFVARLCKDCL